MQVAFAFGTLANTILFYTLKSWVTVILSYYFLFYLGSLLSFIFFIESPPLEIISRAKNPNDAYGIFEKIAEINKNQKVDLTLSEVSQVYFKYH